MYLLGILIDYFYSTGTLHWSKATVDSRFFCASFLCIRIYGHSNSKAIQFLLQYQWLPDLARWPRPGAVVPGQPWISGLSGHAKHQQRASHCKWWFKWINSIHNKITVSTQTLTPEELKCQWIVLIMQWVFYVCRSTGRLQLRERESVRWLGKAGMWVYISSCHLTTLISTK